MAGSFAVAMAGSAVAMAGSFAVAMAGSLKHKQ